MLKYDILEIPGTNTDYICCHTVPMLRYAKSLMGVQFPEIVSVFSVTIQLNMCRLNLALPG